MKVVFLNSAMGKGVTTRLLVELSRDFRNRGEEASVWGLYKEDDTYTSEPGSLYMLEHPPRNFEFIKILFRLIKSLKVHKPDVLFCSLPFANILGALSGKLKGVRNVTVIHHGMFPEYSDLFLRVRMEMLLGMFGLYNNRICVSNSVKNTYVKKIDLFKNRFNVIFNAINLKKSNLCKEKARNKFGLPAQSYLLNTLGRLSPEKNQLFLINLLPKIPNVHLAISGDGVEKEKLVSRATELGIRNRVHFLGHIRSTEVADFLKSGDIFLFPSFNEGFGLAVVEAMESGLPVIASNISALKEVVGDAGILLPLNSELWVDQIKKFMKDDALLSKYSKKSKIRAEAFSFKYMADQYYKIAKS